MAYILYTHVRYASRCLMIDFPLPATALSLSDYMDLVELQDECGSCAGYCVSLGESFFTSGVCSELYLTLCFMLVCWISMIRNVYSFLVHSNYTCWDITGCMYG